jgi:5-hydroxyisourate hydrolase-like protein (transthyretin family)
MATTLSTHVLDTGTGRPAEGVVVELQRAGEVIASATTDADGRIPALGAGLQPGAVTIVFHPPSPFFRRVALDVSLGEGHHHVPLLVSAYSCASYRGS